MWKRFEDEKPLRKVDVEVISADGRRWIGSFCADETCNEVHYQSDGWEVNYIPGPVFWDILRDAP